MRQSRVVTGKHGMVDLMLVLKEAEIKAEDIPVHMQQRQTATKHPKDNGEITKVTVRSGQLNDTTTLCIPTY